MRVCWGTALFDYLEAAVTLARPAMVAAMEQYLVSERWMALSTADSLIPLPLYRILQLDLDPHPWRVRELCPVDANLQAPHVLTLPLQDVDHINAAAPGQAGQQQPTGLEAVEALAGFPGGTPPQRIQQNRALR